MATTFEDDQGRVMVAEQSGGTGGGITSSAHRLATVAERAAHHMAEVIKAHVALELARVGLETAQAKHAEHVAKLRADGLNPEADAAERDAERIDDIAGKQAEAAAEAREAARRDKAEKAAADRDAAERAAKGEPTVNMAPEDDEALRQKLAAAETARQMEIKAQDAASQQTAAASAKAAIAARDAQHAAAAQAE